ncbi:MAG TPA: FAD-dependent monooxygenase [Stellaceae bacterium]|nr:FAD-dependent monooxygenase [Stellaceae bacterium]
MAATEIDAPVLIVGGSLVGMSAAVLLGHHGVRPLLVEHHRGTAIHPRAALVHERTMEILREIGLERAVVEKSEEQFEQDGAVVGVESLGGRELAAYIPNINTGVAAVSPCRRFFVTQMGLEPLLQARARELGADLRFATEMVSFDETPDGIAAIIRHRDTGETAIVRAPYMIAADGAHSRIRERLGIAMQGRGSFSRSATIYFRADVNRLLRGRNLSIIMVTNRALNGFFRFEKPYHSGFLAVHAVGDPDRPDTDVSTGLTSERCRELVHAALGDDDLPVEIENVMPWEAAANVATRFRSGRVLLAGDAAHVMPPYGGFGGNTGIADAHNLAWKLAMVLQGRAGPHLLDSYEAERQPVARFTTEQAYSRYVVRAARYLAPGGMAALEPDLNIELGHVYRSTAVAADAEDGGAGHISPLDSKGRPGTRAPHLFLERGGERLSTLDLFGRGFTWLAGPDGPAAPALDGIDAYRIAPGGDLGDPDRSFPSSYGVSARGAVLVRPDGVVCWHSRRNESMTPGVLDRLLSRPSHGEDSSARRP